MEGESEGLGSPIEGDHEGELLMKGECDGLGVPDMGQGRGIRGP